jgi:hypothetical protein
MGEVFRTKIMQDRVDKITKYQPSRELELFCYALIHQDVKGNKEAAERLSGVKKGKFYWAYKTDEDFRHWYSELCFSILKHNEAIPPYALMGAIIDKDVSAIRTYYELIGKLKGQSVNVTTQVYANNGITPREKEHEERLLLRLNKLA